jgi:drug/metabolite transporter (DMT)-like permease
MDSELSLRTKNVGLVLVTFATFLFSCKSILIQSLLNQQANVEQIIFLRMVFSLPFYISIGYISLRSFEKKTLLSQNKKDLIGMAITGIICYHMASYLDMWSLQHITAGLERLILFTYPVLAAIYKSTQGENLSRSQWASIFIAYLGIVVFYYEDRKYLGSEAWIGIIAVFIAAIISATYVVRSQHYSRKYSSVLFTAIGMVSAGITISLQVVITEDVSTWKFTPEIISGAAIIAVFCTVAPSLLLNKGIASSGVVYASVAGMAGPLLTVLLSSFALGTVTNEIHILGIFMVISGSLGLNWKTISPLFNKRTHLPRNV